MAWKGIYIFLFCYITETEEYLIKEADNICFFQWHNANLLFCIFRNSSNWLISLSIRWVFLFIICNGEVSSFGILLMRCILSNAPWINVRGVRNSWEILVKNTNLYSVNCPLLWCGCVIDWNLCWQCDRQKTRLLWLEWHILTCKSATFPEWRDNNYL